MKIHANAPLGPKGRERMVLRVIGQGWSLAAAAEAAGARPRYDPPLRPLTTPPTTRASDDTVEVAVIVGGVAFLLGAGAARLVRVPHRLTSARSAPAAHRRRARLLG